MVAKKKENPPIGQSYAELKQEIHAEEIDITKAFSTSYRFFRSIGYNRKDLLAFEKMIQNNLSQLDEQSHLFINLSQSHEALKLQSGYREEP